MALILSGDTGPSFNQSAAMPTGSVLQVVQSILSTTITTTSSTFVNTGFSASITPKFATSKILVQCAITCANDVGSSGTTFAIYRGGSKVFPSTAMTTYAQGYFGTNNWRQTMPLDYLDSPATTSSTTYTLYIAAYGGTAYISNDASQSTITLMEIVG